MTESQAASQKVIPQTETGTATNPALAHPVLSRSEWLAARTALLAKEKEYTKLRDQLSAEQRALPWVRIDKEYAFDGPSGKVTLAQLFNGRSQLFLKHFMMGPGQKNNCVGCAFEVDHLEGLLVHLENHDLSYAAVARAPIEEIETYRKNMGWKFTWVSSFRSDFNYDFSVSFTPEQLASGNPYYNFGQVKPGMEDLSGDSVFFRDDAGQIFHTYSTFGRGGEQFLGAYSFLDVTPKGRNENGPYHTLGDWVRPRNMYGKGGTVEVNVRFHSPVCGCSVHK
jgi:predicted dithiol-disulfide oxidoreductase (DUF899 family)